MKSSIASVLVAILFNSGLLHGAALPDSRYALSPMVAVGQEAPDTGGGRFERVGSLAMNNRGEIAFGAAISGSRFTSGIFLLTGGGLLKIALNGEPAPYIGPPLTEDFSTTRLAINNLGQVAFASTIGSWSAGTPQVGVFYFRANDVFPIAVLPPLTQGLPDYVTGVSLNDRWEVAFSKSSGIYHYTYNVITPVIVSGQKSDVGGAFRDFSGVLINNSGQIAFFAFVTDGPAGLYLYSEGGISSIVHAGQSAPGVPGATFDAFEFRLDDAGQVLFSGDQEANINIFGVIHRRFGIYLYSAGDLSPVALVGHAILGQDDVLIGIGMFALSRSGRIGVSGYSSTGSSTYLVSPEGTSRVQPYLDGVAPNNAAQVVNGGALNDSGTLILSGYVPESGSLSRDVRFMAAPITPEFIPPDDFEAAGRDSLPAHWSTVWTNSGTGDVSRFDSNGLYSYSGNSMLRLHVGVGGGSVFALSDPVRIIPERVYAMIVEMRYALASDSDTVAFTVLQYDDAGNQIAINELDGVAADNRWNWKDKAMFIRTMPNASWIRIRFGLISAAEAYADVDDLR